MSGDACRHDRIEVLREVDGSGRMWSCETCFRRFYPACPTCVDVGHRGEIHVPLPPCGHEAEIARLDAVIRRLTTALRVADHRPHDQSGIPDNGFPVCSVCGAIQAGDAP